MWLDNPQDEEQTNVNGQPSTGGSLSVGAGGGTGGLNKPSPSGITGNPSTITPVQSNQPQQQFATVQDYLGANKQQGEDLGQKFTSNLADTAKQEKGTIDTAVAGAQNDITTGTTNFDAGLVNKAASNPTEVANDPGQLNSFLQQWNAAYSGPQSFEASTEYSPAITAANEASDKAAQLSSAGGQQQLLHDQFGVYGQGNQGLDQAILQNSSAYPTVQQAAPAFKSINDYLGSQAQATDAQAQQAAANTAAAKTNTQNAFSNSLSNFQTDLNARTAAAQNQAKTQLTQYQQDLASGDATKVQADLKASGADDATIKNVTDYLTALNKDYQIKPNIDASYIANPNVDINSANVATADDYAKAAALGKLTGVDYSGVLNPADAAQAGTGTLQNVAFKGNDLQNYLKQGLTTQDKSITTGTPNLKTLMPDASNAQQGSQVAQQYIDAFKRAGSPGYGSNDISKLPPQMQQLLSQVNQYPSIVRGPNGQLTQNPQYAGAANIFSQIYKYMQGTV